METKDQVITELTRLADVAQTVSTDVVRSAGMDEARVLLKLLNKGREDPLLAEAVFALVRPDQACAICGLAAVELSRAITECLNNPTEGWKVRVK